MDYLNLRGSERILEIGACFSSSSFNFAKKGCRVAALDISNYLKASNVFVKKAYFDRIFSDMHNMPFADDAFDIVFASAALHHSKDLKAVFEEIRRVLKPGGRVILINESARGIFEKTHPVYKEMNDKGFGDTCYTLSEWKKGALEAGFKNVKIEFLSIADDYITRHKNRGSKDTIKLNLAYFIKNHKKLESFLLSLLIFERFLFRPKSWRLVSYK